MWESGVRCEEMSNEGIGDEAGGDEDERECVMSHNPLKAWIVALMFVLAACVPSQTLPPDPPPGTPFVLADGRFTSGDRSLRIPDGWRVVTGEAGAPLLITLVAPDECGVIVISAAPLADAVRAPACELPLRDELRAVDIAAVRYAISASAPQATWDEFEARLGRVMASIAVMQ